MSPTYLGVFVYGNVLNSLDTQHHRPHVTNMVAGLPVLSDYPNVPQETFHALTNLNAPVYLSFF